MMNVFVYAKKSAGFRQKYSRNIWLRVVVSVGFDNSSSTMFLISPVRLNYGQGDQAMCPFQMEWKYGVPRQQAGSMFSHANPSRAAGFTWLHDVWSKCTCAHCTLFPSLLPIYMLACMIVYSSLCKHMGGEGGGGSRADEKSRLPLLLDNHI